MASSTQRLREHIAEANRAVLARMNNEELEQLVADAFPGFRELALIITPTTGARGLRSQAILAWICQGWKP